MANPKLWPFCLQSSAARDLQGIGKATRELTNDNIASANASPDS